MVNVWLVECVLLVQLRPTSIACQLLLPCTRKQGVPCFVWVFHCVDFNYSHRVILSSDYHYLDCVCGCGLCSWLPAHVTLLARFVQEPSPIRSTVTKAVAEFKRTHADTWSIQKNAFTEDELEVNMKSSPWQPICYCSTDCTDSHSFAHFNLLMQVLRDTSSSSSYFA